MQLCTLFTADLALERARGEGAAHIHASPQKILPQQLPPQPLPPQPLTTVFRRMRLCKICTACISVLSLSLRPSFRPSLLPLSANRPSRSSSTHHATGPLPGAHRPPTPKMRKWTDLFQDTGKNVTNSESGSHLACGAGLARMTAGLFGDAGAFCKAGDVAILTRGTISNQLGDKGGTFVGASVRFSDGPEIHCVSLRLAPPPSRPMLLRCKRVGSAKRELSTTIRQRASTIPEQA